MQKSLYPAPTKTHMKLYVGITDYDWFNLHSSKTFVEEVNFWRPSSRMGFNVLKWGEPFLFKLHSPLNFIVGGGFFTKFLRLPVSLAWEAFGEANGARTLDEVRVRIGKYRAQPIGATEDPVIGCILLEEPFFFERADWIQLPADFKPGIQMGKSYEMSSGNASQSKECWSSDDGRTGERQVRQTCSGNATPRPGFVPR